MAAPMPYDLFYILSQQAVSNIDECAHLIAEEEGYPIERRLDRLVRRPHIRRSPLIAQPALQDDSSAFQTTADPFLKFEILHQDGGEHDPTLYSLRNFLQDNEDVYCTLRPSNVNILLQLTSRRPNFVPRFTITEIEIRAPTVGFTSPIYNGLIFISDKRLNPSELAEYDNYDGSSPIKHKNAIYFCITDPATPWIMPINYPLCGSYVFLKLLSAKSGENIDVRFIGFRGFFGVKSFYTGTIA